MTLLSRKWIVFLILAVLVIIVDVSIRVTGRKSIMYIKLPVLLKPEATNNGSKATIAPKIISEITSTNFHLNNVNSKKNFSKNMSEVFEKHQNDLFDTIQTIKYNKRKETVKVTPTLPAGFVTMPGLVSMDKDLSLPPEVPIRPKSKELILAYSQKRDYSPMISHDDKCGQGSSIFTDLSLDNFKYETDTFLLMIIKSSCTLHDRRDAIRYTWGDEQWAKKNLNVIIKRVFLLGDCTKHEIQNDLLEEDKKYGDILQWNFFDSFRNLTLKDCLFLQWFARNCQNVPYIFKGDDDVFVNTKNIVEYLKAVPRSERDDLFVGSVLDGSPRILDPSWKYYVSYNLYPKKLYPPYVSGGGFLMSSNLAIRLFQASLTHRIFPIDDAFLGTLLESISVKPRNDKTFKSWGLKHTINGCRLSKIKTYHKVSPKELRSLWTNYLETDLEKCPKETDDVFLTQQKR